MFAELKSSITFVSTNTNKNKKDMTTQIENILVNTNATLIVKGKDSIKAMYGKRHVVVSYDKSQDLFNLYAFNLRGVNITKEENVKGLYISQLKETILNLI
jgi:hypothetical protein